MESEPIVDGDIEKGIFKRDGFVKIPLDNISAHPSLVRGILSNMVILRTVSDDFGIAYYGYSTMFERVSDPIDSVLGVPEYHFTVEIKSDGYKYTCKKILPTTGEEIIN